ncbi:mechanosensitive ion channel domain-containing protein [Thiothrix eikelboomii]|uniref:mechanosensitive ion channel domain-containing protein n=1 Tax=Thiothrix eikelboomii TaxID=92487 RepID=UPI003BB18AD4
MKHRLHFALFLKLCSVFAASIREGLRQALRVISLSVLLLTSLSVSAQAATDPFVNLLNANSQAAPVTQLLDGKVISTDISAADDEKIEKRLTQIYQEIDTFKTLKVSVKNAIVTVTGELNSTTDAVRALQYARQIEGVIGINNKITINRSVGRRLVSTWNRITGIIKDGIGSLPVLLIAVLVFSGFWWLGRWLSKRQSFYRRLSDNYFISSLIGQFVNILVIGTGFLVALIILDATSLVKTILGAVGIVGLAISFAVRDTVENYIASILLSIRNPFSMHDLVKIDAQEGRVASLNSRATMLLAADGSYIRIPNSTVFKAIIINYSCNPKRRFSFDLSIDNDQNVRVAQALANKGMEATEGVLDDPKPNVLIQDLIEEKVVLRLQGWVDQEKHSLGKVRSQAIREVKRLFDEAGIFSIEPAINADSPLQEDLEHLKLNDISPEQKVLAEQVNNEENLLSPKAPKEF